MMINSLPTIEVNFQDLGTDVIGNKGPYILKVIRDNVPYEFFIHMNAQSSQVLVIGSGAYNPEKLTLPVFQRFSWYNEFDVTTIYYNDPTLYLGNMSIGWGVGDVQNYYLGRIAEILQVILGLMNVDGENVTFYGSSAGGYMSLMLGSYVKGSRVIVNNPQTYVFNYYQTHVEKLLSYTFKNYAISDIRKEFIDRFSVIERFKKNKYIPKIYYYQNMACTHDMNNHFMPFINELSKLEFISDANTLEVNLYRDEKSGHNPIDKAGTLEIINSVILTRKERKNRPEAKAEFIEKTVIKRERYNSDFENKLDASQLEWELFSNREGYKIVRCNLEIDKKAIEKNFVVQLNDKTLVNKSANHFDRDGLADIYSNGYMYITLLNQALDCRDMDKPSNEVIKEYFRNNSIVLYFNKK